MKRLFILFVVVAGLFAEASFSLRASAQTNLNSITMRGTVVITNMPTQGGGGSTNIPTGRGIFFVDYFAGSDSNPGTNAAAPFQHCPGDPAATSIAASTILTNGSTVYFKPGVQYVVTSSHGGINSGIITSPNGSPSHPVIYDGGLTSWASGRAQITDGYRSNSLAAFGGDSAHFANAAISNVVIKNFDIGPIGGGASLPADNGSGIGSNPGYGIYSYGKMLNVTVANCSFHELGWWQNSKPVGQNTLDGEGIHVADGSISLTVTNCEFTKCHTAIEHNSGISSNLEIVACDFHDYLVWAIDLTAGANSFQDWFRIHLNKFRNLGWAYDPLTYYTGYDGNPYHQDIIFDRPGYGLNPSSAITGTNRNIYANQFYDDNGHTNANPTGYIYLSDTLSVNIYNNLFNVPTAIPNWVIPFTCDTTVTNYNLVRILNNTFILSSVSGLGAYSWNDTHGGNLWQTNVHVFAANNVIYQPFSGFNNICSAIDSSMTNLTQAIAAIKLDFNGYYNPQLKDYFRWTVTTNLFGMRQLYGFETNGLAADPKFMDVSRGFGTGASQNNFGLQTNSPCIGAGTNLTALGLRDLNKSRSEALRSASSPWPQGSEN